MNNRKKAVVLTSGGLDSTTCIGIALDQERSVYPLSVEYGQRHKRELKAIEDVVEYFRNKNVESLPYGLVYRVSNLKRVSIDLTTIGGSALTDSSIEVPTDRDEKTMASDIPITYVPARNTILLSIALAYAEVIKADEIWIGANQVDYSGYPDCREEFLEQFEILGNLATKVGVEGSVLKIKAPLLNLTKAQIIKKGTDLGVPYHLTWSCYKGENKACGICDSCKLRLAGFKEAGSEDPIQYQ